jgi:hypothetical protein
MKNFSKNWCLGACLAGAAVFSFAASAQRFPGRPGPGMNREVEVRLNTTLYPGERLPLVQILDLDRGACNIRIERINITAGNRERGLGELRLISNDRFDEGSRLVGQGYTSVDFFLSRNNLLCRDIIDLDLVNTGRVRLDIETLRASLDSEFRRPHRPIRDRQETRELRCDSRGFKYNVCGIEGEIIDVRLAKKYSDASCKENRSFGFNRDGVWVDNGCSASFLVTVIKPNRFEPRPYLDRLECESISDKYRECFTNGQALSVRLVRQKSSSECREGKSFGLSSRGLWVDRGCRGIFDVEVRR